MLEAVIQIAREAGSMMLEGYQYVEEKQGSADIVTDKDKEIQAYIIQKVLKLLPDAAIMAEEDDVHQEMDGYQWIIDPIDGTTNVVYGYQHNAVSIALLDNHQAILGVCYDPYRNEVFYAQKGKGAFLNERVLHVSTRSLRDALVACGTSPYAKDKADITFTIMHDIFIHARDIRRSGSAVLDICYVACGRVDAFYEASLAPWDYAAAALILQEAGGSIHVPDGAWGYTKLLSLIMGNDVLIAEMRTLLAL